MQAAIRRHNGLKLSEVRLSGDQFARVAGFCSIPFGCRIRGSDSWSEGNGVVHRHGAEPPVAAETGHC
jgi:hypothetical protein